MILFLKQPDGRQKCLTSYPGVTAASVKDEIHATEGLDQDDFYLMGNGKILFGYDTLQDGETYHVVPRLVGGKGGFGSMLRAIGAQIEKTTNREACRDLSGRRMRDVNNEKKLREWVGRQADREKDREDRRRARMERRRAAPKHNFNDPTYEQQKSKVIEDLDDALQEGLKSVAGTSGTSGKSSEGCGRKRKSPMPETGSKKKSREWLGIDIDPDDLSDLDSEDSASESGASPAPLIEDSSNSSATEQKQSDSERQSDSGVESIDTKLPKETRTITLTDSKSGKTAESKEDDQDNADTPPKEMESNSESIPKEASSTIESQMKETSQGQTAQSTVTPTSATKEPVEVELSKYGSAEELESLGLDALKAALMARGLKCGGSLTERSERLFSVKGLTKEEIPPALFSKGGKVKGKGKK